MKRSNTAENAILSHDGHPYGVVLAPDYTAEHEEAPRRLHSTFGIAGGHGGFAEHSATRPAPGSATLLPLEIQRREGRRTIVDRGLGLVVGRRRTDRLGDLLGRWDDAPLVGAWNEDGFALGGYGAGEDAVRIVHEGAATGDIAIWLGGGGMAFSRPGLVVVRPSLTPHDLVAVFDAAQADRRALADAARATGIEDRLLTMRTPLNRGPIGLPPHLALIPSWTGDNRRSRTRHPVVFWLNPMPGMDANFGYFTVEELDQWTQGKGPVPRAAR
jgi:hypothetical protein